MADGTSSYMGSKRWVATGAIDDLNIDSDNDTSTALYFVTPAEVTRLGWVSTTSVTAAANVEVEVYKNGTSGTLLGTWQLATTAGVAAGKVTYAECALYDNDGVATASDASGAAGAIVFNGPTKFSFDAGESITLKVVEAASAGAGIAYVEYIEGALQPESDNVVRVGSFD